MGYAREFCRGVPSFHFFGGDPHKKVESQIVKVASEGIGRIRTKILRAGTDETRAYG